MNVLSWIAVNKEKFTIVNDQSISLIDFFPLTKLQYRGEDVESINIKIGLNGIVRSVSLNSDETISRSCDVDTFFKWTLQS